MSYKSSRSNARGLMIAAASALVLGTIVSLGALYGLNRYFESDAPATNSGLNDELPGR
jgi:hypothetical protein